MQHKLSKWHVGVCTQWCASVAESCMLIRVSGTNRISGPSEDSLSILVPHAETTRDHPNPFRAPRTSAWWGGVCTGQDCLLCVAQRAHHLPACSPGHSCLCGTLRGQEPMSAGGRGPWGRPSRGGARSLRGRTEGDHGPSAFLPTPQVNQIVKKGCNFQNHVPPAILKVLKIFGNSCLATACRLFCTKWSLMILLSFYMAPVARIRAAPSLSCSRLLAALLGTKY